jgi:integrase|nr:MAG TPA: Integrase [Caudoviricetes sp.]
MASIKKRGNSFNITVSCGYDSKGKKIIETSTFTPDPKWSEDRARKAAEKFAVRFEDKIKAGGSASGDKITFEKFSKTFFTDMENSKALAKSTLADYRQRTDDRIIPALGQMKLSQITNHTVKEFLNELRQDGSRMDGKDGTLSESTITKYRATISTVLSYAVEEGYLPINPLIYAGKQRGRGKVRREYKTKQLTVEQAKRFLWILDHPVTIQRKAHTVKRNGKTVKIKEYKQLWSLDLKWQLFFYIALFTGARRGEIVSLLWSDIDFAKSTIHFSKSTAVVKGEIIHKETKTYATRQCAVPDIVIATAKKLMKEQKQICLQLGDYWKGSRGKQFQDNFVFIREDGAQMHVDSPRTEFKRVIRIYNSNIAKDESEMIPDNLTLHDLRHTTASILINKKLDPRSVSGVLGHANTSTTLNIYAYFFHQGSEEAADIMSSVLLDGPAAAVNQN